MKIPALVVRRLLAKYAILPPVIDERYLEHGDITRGTRLHVFCFQSPTVGKCIVVASNRMKWLRACPLSDIEAAQLVREIHELHAIPGSRQEQQTLQHLLVRCSRLYVNEHLLRLRLAPVYLRENGYRIGNASIWSTARIAAAKRLNPHAHDKAAVFAHRR